MKFLQLLLLFSFLNLNYVMHGMHDNNYDYDLRSPQSVVFPHLEPTHLVTFDNNSTDQVTVDDDSTFPITPNPEIYSKDKLLKKENSIVEKENFIETCSNRVRSLLGDQNFK